MNPGFDISTVLVDATIAILTLKGATRGEAPKTLTFPRVLLIGLGVTLILTLKGVAISVAVTGFFGLIRAAYLNLVVVVPIVGLVILSRPRNQSTHAVKAMAAIMFLLAPVGVYATFIEPFRLRMERADVHVSAARAGGDAITIAVAADIQTTHVSDYEHLALDRIMEQTPDVILLPGDLFQGTEVQLEAELSSLRGLLNRLKAPGGVYFVPGNVESAEHAAHILERTGVRLLVNDIVRISVRDREVTIGGVELRRTPESRRVIERLESSAGNSDIRILLAHLPDHAFDLSPDSRIDLVVAGHTHGGQVVIPFIGPPITFTAVPRDVAAGGLHEMDGGRIYVSRGIGCERGYAPRIRFLCPPEISILTLR